MHHHAAIRYSILLLLALAAVPMAATVAGAQDWDDYDRRSGCRRLPDELPANRPYDGKVTFARIRFEPGGERLGGSRRFGWGWGGRSPGWGHDYPCAERNLMSVLDEITAIQAFRSGSNILELDDPELFRYPIAYFSEPGGWVPTDEDTERLREYLLKGGFAIFDDFSGRDWFNFVAQMRRVLPEGELIPLGVSHPVFSSFFQIESLDVIRGEYGRRPPEYYGIFENNDPTGRLMVVVNYNNDIGEIWEYAHTGFEPIDLTNEALKLGVNYFVYALTH